MWESLCFCQLTPSAMIELRGSYCHLDRHGLVRVSSLGSWQMEHTV